MIAPVGGYGQPVGLFSPEQAATINEAVDIQLLFMGHGQRISPAGRYVFVDDTDYAATGHAAAALRPGTDAIASEMHGWEIPAAADVPERLRELREDYLALQTITDDTDLLEAAQQRRLVDPFDYALGHASLRGVDVHYADMAHEHLLAFRQGLAQRHPNPVVRGVREQGHRLRERDLWTMQNVGSIALDMADRTSERAVLQVLRGAAHQQRLEAMFDENGIRYTSQTVTHSRETRRRLHGEMWRALFGERKAKTRWIDA